VDIFQIIETLGVPIAVSVGLGYALMYLIKFITRDVKADIKNLYDITVKLIDKSNRQENDSKKTLTAVNTMKDIFIKLFKMFKKNE